VFWWIFFLVLQQTERLFLLPQALSLETPSPGLLFKTLVIGLRADFITSTLGIVIAVLLAGGLGVIFFAFGRWFAPLKVASPYRLGFFLAAGLVAVLFLILLTVDMVYSYYNQQHLNFVFFEYLSDLFASHNDAGIPSEQAEQQTGAELQDLGRWAWRLSAFAFAEGIAIAAWWFVFRRLQPLLARYGRAISPATANTILLVSLVGGMLGFHPQGPYAIRSADINSAVYYTLAQNPILYASEALRATLDSRTLGTRSWVRDDMRIDEAIRLSHEAVGNTAVFPDPRYPFVREMAIQQGVRFAKPVNVLLIFIEALDRR
jgi:hypothetical protein